MLVEISQLSKSYGGAQALRDVTLVLERGEVHALCGENGAGKSTLIKCLTGVTSPDTGSISIAGRELPLGDVSMTEAAGVAVLHQESTAFPHLNAIDNIYVGRELCRFGGWLLDHPRMRRETQRLLDRLGQSIDLDRPTGQLSVASRQMIAMARALSHDCRLLIMDEPTASLSARETEVLMEIVTRLRNDGVTILYVSHRLEEVLQLADRVSVLRDGCLVATRDQADVNRQQLIEMMVGRPEVISAPRTSPTSRSADPYLQVNSLTRVGSFYDISLQVNRGEILGLAGLVGAGRSEVVRALFGIDDYTSGSIHVEGCSLPRHDVQAAMRLGLGLIPEDRQHEGLVLPMSVGQNLTLAALPRFARYGWINRQEESVCIADLLRDLQVKAASHRASAQTLSGGNQQKLVLGKWLAISPKVLILDEPTRGVDVGAKRQVHELIRKLVNGGMAALVISSEIPELLNLCDRVLVMRAGRLVGELRDSMTAEQILQLALPDVT